MSDVTSEHAHTAPAGPIRAVIDYFAGHPTAANLLMLIFLFMGGLSITTLQRETFPDFAAAEVEVVVAYPGATALTVESEICERIEDAVDAVVNVAEVRSTARENRGVVVVQMQEGADFSMFLNDVKTEVDAIDDFPDEAEAPVVSQLHKTDLVAAVAVSGPMDESSLHFYCAALKDRMVQREGLRLVEIQGFSQRQFRVTLAPETLMQLGLSVEDVARAIERQSVDLPAGVVETKQTDLLVRFDDERADVAALEALVVSSNDQGAELRLGDVATIAERFELDEAEYRFDGRRAGLLEIRKTKQQDALDTLAALETFLEEERAAAPPGVSLTLTKNVSKIIGERLDLLAINGVQGLLLVFGAMWLFFTFRFSFWVAMGLPVSFMGALFFLPHIDFSLNMLTMVGLLLAIGLLMDDAIVIAENVAAHLERGKKAHAAVVDGVTEVFPGVLSSYLTTMLIFGSIAVFIAGDIGKVLWVMPVVLLLTLTVSLVEAFLILPNHLAHALHGREAAPRGRFRLRVDAAMDHLRERVLGPAADVVVRWRYLFTGAVVALFLLSGGMLAGGVLKTVAFPDIDGDVLEARILLPQGTPLERTRAVVETVTAALEDVNRTLTPEQPTDEAGEPRAYVQHYSVQYNVNRDAGEQGPHVATISVDLLSAEIRATPLDEFTAAWRNAVGTPPDVLALTYKEPSLGPAGLDIEIRLLGEDLDELNAAARELVDWLRAYDGVEDLTHNLRPGKPELVVTMREGALSMGVSAMDVASQLRAAFHGVTAQELQTRGEAYEIDVRLAPGHDGAFTPGDVAAFRVTMPDGSQAPLTAVAHIEEARGWAAVSRVDRSRAVTVQGTVDRSRATANAVLEDTRTRFLPELLERRPGIRVSMEGQSAEGAKTGASLGMAFLVGVVGVFVLLSFQFRSYLEPFVVMLTIPLALTGVIWGHLAMGYDLSMPSIMGFVSLAGVVVNDSILLVQFIKKAMAQGMRAAEAAVTASKQRFRAIMLTSATTVAGLLPLTFEKSPQAQVLIPLALSIVFGLLAASLLVLFVVPAFYAILDDFRRQE